MRGDRGVHRASQGLLQRFRAVRQGRTRLHASDLHLPVVQSYSRTVVHRTVRVAGRTDVGKHVSSVGGTDSHGIPINEREEGMAPLDAGIDSRKELCQNVCYETKTYVMKPKRTVCTPATSCIPLRAIGPVTYRRNAFRQKA